MKRLIFRLFVLIVFAAILAGGYVWMRASDYLAAPLGQGGARMVTIPEGATFKGAVAALAKVKIVEDPLVFEWFGRWRGAGRNIKAGTYAVDMAMTPRQLLDKLEAGGLPRQVRLTIPEGFNRWQIADRAAELTALERAAFLKRVAAEDLEGRLYPDTYYFRPEAGTHEVIEALTRRFDQVFAQVLAGHPEAAKYRADPKARRWLVTMASLIEKETRTQADRRKVSRVFYNRLEKGMRLQTDPTCMYAENLYKKRPHPRYCKDPNNLYSTYVIDTLPPGPIANPGRAALDAALRPADDPDSTHLLYFVARRDGSGEHDFSRTYAEHKEKVNRYLKGKR